MAKKAAPAKGGKMRGHSGKVSKGNGRPAAAPRVPPARSAEHDGLFPVVGVGASAGGLEAFTELLKALPENPQMAFVFVQHMAPTHESMLPRLLSKVTTMAVLEVTDGLTVKPNHVYIIPPNAAMTISGGVLRLAARKEGAGKSLPIDDFFWALADDRGSAAIGVILSGTASDGTQGIKAIKAAGGITFAQDQATARFPEMPRNAVAAGCVDFSLPPTKIERELARIGRHPYLQSPEEPEPQDVSEVREPSLRRICLLLRSTTGVDFHLYKPATLTRRVARRMALQKIDSRDKYLKLLRANRAEVNALYEDIFVHVTGFFRDPEALDAIRHTILPRFLSNQQPEDAIRVWVAGCSSGEEVYSIAMILLEELGDRAGQKRIQIFGTDVSQKAIEQARNGIYQEPAINHVSPERRRRFFVKVENGYQISKFVRDMCVFARHDVTKDPPFSRLDLISCRNVLIYLGPVLQKRVAEMFHYALRPSGCLLLGKSESLSAHTNLFAAEDPKLRIFSRKPLTGLVYPTAILEQALGQRTGKTFPLSPAYDIRHEAERVLLERFVPAPLVVDPDLQIVHFQGNTSHFLAPATGQPSFHLLRMVRPELVVDLRTAIQEVKKTSGPSTRSGIRIKHNGSTALVDLQVLPLPGRHAKEIDFLVIFHESRDRLAAEAGLQKAQSGQPRSPRNALVVQLQGELAATREQLKTIIEEHEATGEEMAAVNEEVVSSNEELQSTNEELETAKEELQSSNEELITLNDELQNRNAELGQLAADLSNLLVGVEIPVVILDTSLRIRRFTPTAEKVLNLIATDVGRPFTDLAPALDVTDWAELAREVIDRRRVLERDVRDRKGHWYGLRMRPYQSTEHNVEGVLMALMDIDSVKRSLDEAREARDLAEDLVETVRAPLLILDSDLQVLKATRRYYETFGTTAAETEGRNFFDLGGGQWIVPALRNLLDEILPRDARVENFEVAREFPAVGYRCMLLNARRILRPAAGKPMILIAMEDITERKQAEEVLKQRDRVLQEATSQAIVSAGADGKIRMVNLRASEMFGYSRQELLDMPVDLLLPESCQQAHAAHRTQYLADPGNRVMGDGRDLKGRRKDGTEFPISVHLSHIETKDGPLAIDIITDLTELKKAEETLKLTQERLSLAQEVAGIGVWDWDLRTNQTRYSREWGPLYGFAPGTQLQSHDDWLLLIHPDDRGRILEARQQAFETGQTYHVEFRVVWPDGSTHWLQGRGTALRDEAGALVRMIGVSVDVTNIKRAEAECQVLLSRLAKAQEEERRRISRELHDDLIQKLAGLAMDLGGLAAEFPAASERLKRRLRAAQGALVQVAEGARHVAHELHPSELDDLGLTAALQAYSDDFAKREGIAVDFRGGHLRNNNLSREGASCLYRVTQESLRNVSKHAHARKASVTLDEDRSLIRLRIRDDGGGFSIKSLAATGGLGILGMKERVRLANGTFDIRSEPGSGTEITVELPLREEIG